MSKSVGVTYGIAAQLLLDGYPALNTHGVLAPYENEICDPIREKVELEGTVMAENVDVLDRSCRFLRHRLLEPVLITKQTHRGVYKRNY